MHEWKNITSDRFIIDIVRRGLKIDFESKPHRNYVPKLSYNPEEQEVISLEIKKLLKKGVIKQCEREEGDFVSTVFTRKKKDGINMRTILNLKSLNEHVVYHHFKMESLSDVFKIIQPNCWMASVDLKDAFYTIPIHKEYQKFFKFIWQGKFFVFLGMPQGYSDAMRIFTKIMKPPFSTLRKQGHLSVAFVDDSYLQGNTKAQCQENISKTLNMLKSLGFIIHTDKSVLEPTQSIEFLGFVINSVTMTVEINEMKSQAIINKIEAFLIHKKPTVRLLASVIGSCISLLPALPLGKLHYRNLEKEKTKALKLNKGNFNGKVKNLNPQAIKELYWWLKNIPRACRNIHLPQVDFVIYTDASETGWGATDSVSPIGGKWEKHENGHINFLELKAILKAIQGYHLYWQGRKHIRIKSDNTTAIAYVNNMGGTVSQKCNNLSKFIWEFCTGQGVWISAEHIPGSKNNIADHMSRKFNENTEWQLDQHIFIKLLKYFSVKPSIDLFASDLNKQLTKYCSWQPDPKAFGIDAFNMTWTDSIFYAFPPFSLVGKSISKIIREEATGLMIIPWWPTQNWFPLMIQHLVDYPVVLPSKQSTLKLPRCATRTTHPLFPKLKLLAVHLSGNRWEIEEFQKKLWTSSANHGEKIHQQDMGESSKSGNCIAHKDMQIPIIQM